MHIFFIRLVNIDKNIVVCGQETEISGAYCFTSICLPVSLSVCPKLSVKTSYFPVPPKPSENSLFAGAWCFTNTSSFTIMFSLLSFSFKNSLGC